MRSVPTAQEAYRDMVKAHLAPGLRALGFKGSGRNYELPCPEHWAMLGLQSSKWNDSREVHFTVNLLVVRRDVWERERVERSYLGAKPTANTRPGGFAWSERLGILMPKGRDEWWRLKAGEKSSKVAQKVLNAIEVYGLPAMRAQCRS